MCRFWAGGISSFPFSRAREYRLLRRLTLNVMNSNILFIIYYSVVFYAFFILSGDGYSSGLKRQLWLGGRDP
jgi:hypothetical protein